MDNQKYDRIQKRLNDTAPHITPGEWYHEDVPMLLHELSIAERTCPNGGNDGYITPRPCQMINCEDCHAKYEATMDGIRADRDYWKARAESLELKNEVTE